MIFSKGNRKSKILTDDDVTKMQTDILDASSKRRNY
jgi:hypothetical protein